MTKDRTALVYNPTIHTVRDVQPNQNVTLSLSSNILTVTSNQARSTPGIIIANNLLIKKGEFYEFIVKGKVHSGATAYLWGDLRDDHSTRITAITSDSTVNLSSTTGSVSALIGGFTSNTRVRLGILFDSPSVGDKFEINGYAVVERKNMQLGDWMIYDMPNNLVFDNKNDAGEWKFVAALTKRT